MAEMQRDPSSFLGGAGKDLGGVGLSSSVVVLLKMAHPALTLEEGLAIVTVGAVVFGYLRRGLEELVARRRA